MFYYICFILAYLPLLILYPTRVIGKKNIPKKGKMILCCNHQSNADVPLIATRLCRRRYKYMAKDSLFKNKLLGAILKNWGGYPIKRGETDLQAVKKTLGYLKADKAVCIFPEGTRVQTTDQNNLKDGVILFAIRSKAPIVPAMMIRKPRIFRRNRLVVGKPFNLSEMEEFKDARLNDELMAKGKQILHDRMFELLDKYQYKKKKKKKDK